MREVTEHQAFIYCCARSDELTQAAFPEGVASAAQHGERPRGAAIYLNLQQLVPEDRVARSQQKFRVGLSGSRLSS